MNALRRLWRRYRWVRDGWRPDPRLPTLLDERHYRLERAARFEEHDRAERLKAADYATWTPEELRQDAEDQRLHDTYTEEQP